MWPCLNVIIPLMLSLLSRPKVITLSGFYFTIQLFSIQNQKFPFVRSFISPRFVLWCCTRCSCCCCCYCWLCFIETITLIIMENFTRVLALVQSGVSNSGSFEAQILKKEEPSVWDPCYDHWQPTFRYKNIQINE